MDTVASVDVNCPDTRTVGKPTDPARLELTTMPFAGICSTTDLRIHDEFTDCIHLTLILQGQLPHIKIIICIFLYNPYFQIKWFKDEEPLTNKQSGYDVRNNRLRIQKIRQRNEGVFRCQAENFLQTVSAESQVSVGKYTETSNPSYVFLSVQ